MTLAGIGTRNRDNTVRISEIKVSDGVYRVTIQELWGNGRTPANWVEFARRLARRVLPGPVETWKVDRWQSGACGYVTFKVVDSLTRSGSSETFEQE